MSLQRIQIGLISSMLVWVGSVLPAVAVPAFLYAEEPGSQINIRSSPTTRSAARSYGIPGNKVETLRKIKGEDGYTWYYVRFSQSGATGWVRGDFVRFSSNSSRISQKIPDGEYVGGWEWSLEVKGNQYRTQNEIGIEPWRPISELKYVKEGMVGIVWPGGKKTTYYCSVKGYPYPKNPGLYSCTKKGWIRGVY